MNTARIATFVLLLTSIVAHAQPRIRSISEVIVGHSTGGVTIDQVGNVYVADFGDFVWKITPEGSRQIFASGLYGASGNAIDREGNLLQSNYYGDSVTKIDRVGRMTVFASGLDGPVGITIDRQSGKVFVANCRGNSIARIDADGTVSLFAKSALFNCPNGAAFDREGNLYVVNYRSNDMLKIDPHGSVAPFAKLSAKGLAAACK